MKASDYQVGGNHYSSTYQHWDWAIDIRLGYLESAATKYITRWKGKNGVQDVEKGIHYLTKAKEAFLERRYHNGSTMLSMNASLATVAAMHTERFCDSNNLTTLEERFMIEASIWKSEVNLDTCIDIAKEILRMAVGAAQGAKGSAAPQAPTTGLKPPQAAKTGGSGRPAAGRTNHPAPYGYDDWSEGDI